MSGDAEESERGPLRLHEWARQGHLARPSVLGICLQDSSPSLARSGTERMDGSTRTSTRFLTSTKKRRLHLTSAVACKRIDLVRECDSMQVAHVMPARFQGCWTTFTRRLVFRFPHSAPHNAVSNGDSQQHQLFSCLMQASAAESAATTLKEAFHKAQRALERSEQSDRKQASAVVG